MKNISILILKYFFLSLILLWESRHGISCNISLSLTIVNLKIVTKELLGLTDLTKAQVLCIYELMEVVIINEDKDLVFIAFQVMILSFAYFNNG